MFQFIPLGRARSRACTLQQGQSPRGRPVTREARGTGWGGGVDRAEPERLSPGRWPGREQLPAAPTMAAAAVGQVGSRPHAWGLGNGEGRRTSGRTTRSQPVRLGAVPLALGFRCEAPRNSGGALLISDSCHSHPFLLISVSSLSSQGRSRVGSSVSPSLMTQLPSCQAGERSIVRSKNNGDSPPCWTQLDLLSPAGLEQGYKGSVHLVNVR